jgi:hypothetical protein
VLDFASAIGPGKSFAKKKIANDMRFVLPFSLHVLEQRDTGHCSEVLGGFFDGASCVHDLVGVAIDSTFRFVMTPECSCFSTMTPASFALSMVPGCAEGSHLGVELVLQ